MKHLIMLLMILWGSLTIAFEKKYIIFDEQLFNQKEHELKGSNPFYLQGKPKEPFYCNFVFITNENEIQEPYISVVPFELDAVKQEDRSKRKREFIDQETIEIKKDEKFTSLNFFYENTPQSRKLQLFAYCLLYILENQKAALVSQKDVIDFSHKFMEDNLKFSVDDSIANVTVYILLNANDMKSLKELLDKIFILKKEINFDISKLIENQTIATIAQICNEKYKEQKLFSHLESAYNNLLHGEETFVKNLTNSNRLDEKEIHSTSDQKHNNDALITNQEIKAQANPSDLLYLANLNNKKFPPESVIFANIVKLVPHQKARNIIWKINPYVPNIVNYSWKAYQAYILYSTLKEGYTTVKSLHTTIQKGRVPQIPPTTIGKAKTAWNLYSIYITFSDLFQYTESGIYWLQKKVYEKNNTRKIEENK